MFARKQPVVLKLDLYSSLFILGRPSQTTVTGPSLRASFEVNLCPILKTNTPLQRPCNSLNEGCLARIKEKWLRDGRSKLADASPLTARKENRQWLGLHENGLLARIKKEMTPWWSFEISRRFTARHAESWAANRWSLRHSHHEEVTNHSAHWTPLIRIHTYNGIANFWNGYNSRKRRLLRVLLFRTWSTRWREVTVLKACAYDVRKAPIRDLLISIHKTRDFEWQTAHKKGCQENRCVRPAAAYLAISLLQPSGERNKLFRQ